MKKLLIFKNPLLLLGFLWPLNAFAHKLTNLDSGFAEGILHPLSGADHTLTMIGVGILAYQLGGIWRYSMLLAFIVSMLLGGWLGLIGNHAIPVVEYVTITSAVLITFSIALQKTESNLVYFLLTIAAALCHGHSHGVEVSLESLYLNYCLGFTLTTICLYIIGIMLGCMWQNSYVYVLQNIKKKSDSSFSYLAT